MKCFVQQIFPHYYQYPFLQRIQDYHDETGEAIHISMKYYSNGCPVESALLTTISNQFTAHHIALVSEYLPPRVFLMARYIYHRTQYNDLKKQSLFIEKAMRQIGEYDNFFMSMENVHECDALLTLLLQQRLYYQEHFIFLSLRNRNN